MPHNEKGSALLTALFIMTLVAVVATAMSIRLQTDIYRTRLTVTHDKLYLSSQLLTFWAVDELKQPNKVYTKVLEQGYVALFPKTLENLTKPITVTGGLYDLQALYNLNNMQDAKAEPGFINFITKILPQLGVEERKNLAQSLRLWLTPFDPIEYNESDSTYYLKQSPPYYPGNVLMQSRSEFRLLPNVSASVYLKAEPYLTVLPESKTPINVNTASKEVLLSLGAGVTEETVNQLITLRQEGFKNTSEAATLLTNLNLTPDQITVESSYFLAVAHVSFEDFHLEVYTMLKRRNDNNKLVVNIIRESINGF